MKYFLPFFIIAVFFAAGCNKTDMESRLSANCSEAEYPFACYLDKALAAKDPNLCNQGAIPRITCLTAYEEIMENPIACNELADPLFGQECEEYKRWEQENKNRTAEDTVNSIPASE
jgi:hypothetical protein